MWQTTPQSCGVWCWRWGRWGLAVSSCTRASSTKVEVTEQGLYQVGEQRHLKEGNRVMKHWHLQMYGEFCWKILIDVNNGSNSWHLKCGYPPAMPCWLCHPLPFQHQLWLTALEQDFEAHLSQGKSARVFYPTCWITIIQSVWAVEAFQGLTFVKFFSSEVIYCYK